MAVKFHCCPLTWLRIGGHPCWKVHKALDEAGVDYVVVKGPLSRSKRVELERLSGQRLYPVIEFEDGSVYREQSKDMAARIKGGKLMDAHTARPSRSEAHAGPGESSGKRANASEDQGGSDPAS